MMTWNRNQRHSHSSTHSDVQIDVQKKTSFFSSQLTLLLILSLTVSLFAFSSASAFAANLQPDKPVVAGEATSPAPVKIKKRRKKTLKKKAVSGIEKTVDGIAGKIVGVFASVIFYDVWIFDNPAPNAVNGQNQIDSIDERIKLLTKKIQEITEYENEEGKEKTEAPEITDAEEEKLASLESEIEALKKKLSQLKSSNVKIPLAVLWLVFGAVFLTLRMGFINIRGFKHALLVTAGKYDDEHDVGEVSHFQALSSALSATVGLGNIAGVAIAISVGGPGAVLWLIIAGFLGMSSKFAECTLGQKYRSKRADGSIMGGAMYYLSDGLKDLGLGGFGKVLAVLFALLCIGGSFGGGNAFQVNQSLNALEKVIPWLGEYRWVYGAIMVGLTGVVIIGGVQRIATVASKIVPLMCGLYVLACLYILGSHIGEIGGAFQLIFTEAFSLKAGWGGLIGTVMVQGFRRAAFSNEAGVGSAPIAHSAAKTEYPVREGIVALLEPFIDTIVVCTMTALVIIITGAYDSSIEKFAALHANADGAGLTVAAMKQEVSWFPYVLSAAVVLFAYSTMISWSYYGERCWVYLFGEGSSLSYKILFLVVTFLGSIVSATNVLDLSDLMILGMAIPNLIGVLLLSGMIKKDLNDYWAKYQSGEFNKTSSSGSDESDKTV